MEAPAEPREIGLEKSSAEAPARAAAGAATTGSPSSPAVPMEEDETTAGSSSSSSSSSNNNSSSSGSNNSNGDLEDNTAWTDAKQFLDEESPAGASTAAATTPAPLSSAQPLADHKERAAFPESQPQQQQQQPQQQWTTVRDAGLAHDQNSLWRPTMEDEAVMIDQLGAAGQSFFGVYDGHGGRETVEVVKTALHRCVEQELLLAVEHHRRGHGQQPAHAAPAASSAAAADELVPTAAAQRNRHQQQPSPREQQAAAAGASSTATPAAAAAAAQAPTGQQTAEGAGQQQNEPQQQPQTGGGGGGGAGQQQPQLDLSLHDVQAAFARAFERTDRELREAPIRVSGCTALACLVLRHSSGERTLHIANVGDSRAVLCRNGQAERLSYDHKPTDQIEIERIRNHHGGFIINGRVAGILAVSRAFGDLELKPYGVSAEPYQNEVLLESSDTYLIMACDGLWDVMSDQEACDFIMAATAKSGQPPPTAQQLSDQLVKNAIQLGTRDNVTTIVVQF